MAVRLGILGLLIWLTLGQEPHFQDDLALWQHAAYMNRTSPRPVYNLGVLWRKQGQQALAAMFFVMAGDVARGRPEQDVMTRKVRAQLQYLEMMGYPACVAPSAQPYCF